MSPMPRIYQIHQISSLIMATYRLKENHPTYKKVEKVFALAEKLGISFYYTRAGYMMVADSSQDAEFFLSDVDSDLPCETIPHHVEFKLTYEKD